jgi:ABC-2 type transport system ATP-binding protein
MIEVKNLTKNFGDITAVDNLSFHVNKGEIFGFLGPNGAGKTTTIRMLCCLISKTSGEAKIGGYEIGNKAHSIEIRKMIGIVPDNVGLYNGLTAYENLDFYGKLYDCSASVRKENIEYYLRMMGLWEKRNLNVGNFSKGMRQKIAIARGLIHNPELLFLDEITASLDPESSKVIIDLILKFKNQGKTIFLNTHNLDEAQKICDRIGILKTKLLAISTPQELQKSIWGNKTAFQIEKITDSIIAAVRSLNPMNLVIEQNKIIIEVRDPLKENPLYIATIISAGGRIQFVTSLIPDLEETYLKIMEVTK